MLVHLVDGTYELFRHFFGVPPHRNAAGEEVGAARGVLRSIAGMLADGATHIGVATDHVIESFRNDLYPGYKTGAGIEPALLEQFTLIEDALRALGVTVWPMVEMEADDALASAAEAAARDPRVEQVLICTPDKDLAQCVRGSRVVQVDRRNRTTRDEAGVRARFGVDPSSIPDLLALTGDSADGFPGLPGWGPKSAAAVLARYRSIDRIPQDAATWDVPLRGAARLAGTLASQMDAALLFKDLATLRTDAPVGSVDGWLWAGPTEALGEMCVRLDAPDVAELAGTLARGDRPGPPVAAEAPDLGRAGDPTP